jgi:hypothetical protein
VKFQRGEMATTAKVDAWRRLGLVVEVETGFYHKLNSTLRPVRIDRVWVRWLHPSLGFMEVEPWPATALTRPQNAVEAAAGVIGAERRTEPQAAHKGLTEPHRAHAR